MFPNDTKNFFFDSVDDKSCSSTTSILMPSVSHDRTILWVSTYNKSNKSNDGADVHINFNTFPALLFDGERASYLSTYIYAVLPANKPLYCYKSQDTHDHVAISVLYTDYNLASTTQQTGTSTISTSTENFYNGFSAGSIVISVICVFIVLILFIKK